MSHLFRMTIDIPVEDHRRLKALAAVMGKSMREIISDWIHGNLYSENVPNAETLKVMSDIEKGKNLIESKDIQDMFRKLGI
jgi:predicted transcriptional regulator